MRGFRLIVLVGAAAIASAVVPGNAHSSLFFLFEPTTAQPNDEVTVRLGGTPENFQLSERVKPFQQPMRIYLVPNATAGKVRSRFDQRLYYVGSLVPDARARGVLNFQVPPFAPARYAIAAWCPGCAQNSRGRTFFVQQIRKGTVGRYLPMMLLRLKPSSTTCPVTKTSDGRYGTEALWTTLPRSGVLVRRDLFDKLPWIPDTSTEEEALSVSGRMLEAPFLSLRVLGVNWGYSSSGRGSWASAVSFRREGCWKITGRVSDVTLTYVLRVVRGG